MYHTNDETGDYPNVQIKPFGKYLKEKYENDFFTVSIRTQNGAYLTAFVDTSNSEHKQPQMIIDQLDEPPSGSLENYLSQIDMDYFYVPTSVFSMHSLQQRVIGNKKVKEQFMDLSAHSTDGILFIRHCDALFYPPEKINTGRQSIKVFLMIGKHGDVLFPKKEPKKYKQNLIQKNI